MRIPEPKPTLVGFSSKRAAQVAAFFVLRDGGSQDKLKLIKLMYLSERMSIEQRRRPMLYDEYYSLQHGPICSNALNGLNGEIEAGVWNKYVKLTGTKSISATRDMQPADFDELSKSDLKILEQVWTRWGGMTASGLRKWTHANCPEYTEIEHGRVPISAVAIAEALGIEKASEIADEITEYRRLEAAVLK